MAIGKKTGGRRAGTPNRRTTELAKHLSILGCDPIEGMAKLAMDQTNPPELRGRMYSELAGNLYPKRKATEIKIDDGPKVTFQFLSEPEFESKVESSRFPDQSADKRF